MSASESSFYVTGGTLRHDAPSYVERQADRVLLDGLLKGEFCYVLTSRQMGKSSLMVRTATKLREEGIHVVVLDLTAIGQNLTPDQWYGGLLERMGQQLRLEPESEQFWSEQTQLGPCQRLFTAIRGLVLPKLPVASGQPAAVEGPKRTTENEQLARGQIVIFVDELDVVRSLPFSTDEFFAAIRECYNRRTEDRDLDRLTFCLLGVATPSDLIRDTRTTPFNIGRRIELNDFTYEEAAPLARGLQHLQVTIPNPQLLLQRVLFWTSGHPYLTQRLCHAIAQNTTVTRRAGVDQLCSDLFLSSRARERDDNLLFVRERLLRSDTNLAGMLSLYEQAHRGKQVLDEETNPQVSTLRLAGIVQAVDGEIKVRNRIYHEVFNRAWVRANMPDAELRRQQAAFRQGVVRTAAIAVLILSAMALLALYAVRQARMAREASAQAYLDKARAGRWSGRAGQRFDGLAALSHAAGIRPTPEIRNEAIACLALADLRPAKQWAGFPAGAKALALANNFERYARANSNGTISIRQVDDHRELFSFAGGGVEINRLLFSPNDQYVVVEQVGELKVQLRVLDLNRREEILTVEGLSAGAWNFSPDSERLAVAKLDGSIEFQALASGQATQIPSQGQSLSLLSFSPDGTRLAVSTETLLVYILDATTGGVLKPLAHRGHVSAIAWHPDGAHLATACSDLEIYVWEIEKGEPYQVLKGSEAEPQQLAFNHGGDLLASLGADGTLRLWHPFTGRQLVRTGGDFFAPRLQFSKEDRLLGPTVAGPHVTLWEVKLGRECRTLHGHVGAGKGPNHLDVSGDGRLLASAGGDGVQLWDLPGNKKLGFLKLGATRSVLFVPDLSALIASDIFGLHRFPITPRLNRQSEELRIGPAENWDFPPPVGQAALSSDGKFLALIHNTPDVPGLDPADPHLHVMALGGERTRREIKVNTKLDTVAISPEGRWVAACSAASEQSKIWNARTGQEIRTLPLKGPARFAFSPNGQWLVSSTGEEYRFWKTGTWEPASGIARTEGAGQSGPLAFSADGKWLAISSSPSVVELVDGATALSLAVFEAPDQKRLSWLCFSRDAHYLVAATENQLIQVWDLPLIREQLARRGLDWDSPSYFAPPKSPETPPRLHVQVELGNLETRLRNPNAELVAADTAIKADPNDADAYHQRGHVYEEMKNYQQALLDFSQSLKLQPDQPAVHRDRANMLYELEQLDEALEAINHAIHLSPNSASQFSVRGNIYLRRNDRESALRDFSTAISLNATNSQYYYHRGWAYAEKADWESAKADLWQAVQLGRTNAPGYWAYGLAALAQGDTNAYRRACEEIFERFGRSSDHKDVSLCARLSALVPGAFNRMRDLVRAAEQAIDVHPDNSRFMLSLCLVMYRDGRFEDVIQRLQQALSNDEADPETSTGWRAGAYSLLALAHARLGQRELARGFWAKAKPLIQHALSPSAGKVAPLNWAERLELRTLGREAEQLVK